MGQLLAKPRGARRDACQSLPSSGAKGILQNRLQGVQICPTRLQAQLARAWRGCASGQPQHRKQPSLGVRVALLPSKDHRIGRAKLKAQAI
jgi:hypothetical protein